MGIEHHLDIPKKLRLLLTYVAKKHAVNECIGFLENFMNESLPDQHKTIKRLKIHFRQLLTKAQM